MAANDFEATRVHEGDNIDYTPSGAAVSAGEVLMVGTLLCVAARDIADGELGTLQTEGAFRIKKETGSVSFALGDPVYWDAADNELNDDNVGNPKGGIALEAAGTSDATVLVKINR